MPALKAQTIISTQQFTSSEESAKWRVSLNGGYGYRLGKIDDNLNQDTRNYLKKLKNGYSISGDITYYLVPGYGFGIKYSKTIGSSSAYGTVTYNNGTSKQGTISDNVGLVFIGPYISSSTAGNGSKHVFVLNCGLGYVGYKDLATTPDPVIYSGSTAGYYLGLGYDYSLSNKCYIGAELSMVTGVLSSITKTVNGISTTNKLSEDEKEGVAHITACVGIRFYL